MDLALAAVAGHVGTEAMGPVSTKLYEFESPPAPARGERGPTGAPYRIAAEKLTAVFGLELTEQQSNRLSLVFHYGLAIPWAPLYPLLRRRTSLVPAAARLATGAAMSVVADELMTPAFGLSAPNLDYPLVTHVRGFLAHLLFGLAAAAVIETGWKLTDTRP